MQTRVINYVEKNIEEIFPKWDNDREDVAVENIIQVMFNAPPNWKWPMNCWEDEGIYPWTNPKTHVVYVKEESSVKSLVVREEDIERPSKRARTEALAEPRSEDIPDARSGAISEARSEASIPSESVNGAKAKQDEEPSSSKTMSVEVKEKEVKEGKEKELKEKATKGLEKVKEAKANEAKSNEAKTKEAKAKEAKAKEVKAKKAKAKEAKAKEKKAKKKETKEKETKEKEEKEAKLAAEAWLGDAKLTEEAWLGDAKQEEEAKAKEAVDKVLSTEPEGSAEASVVLKNKDKNTVSDVKMHEARKLSKKDSALVFSYL
ncbi:hypothetical protein N665_0376s0007 [Sinapis alba]|nr:hypothetical protein N665_0376s0007 [Sinapis alba]